MLIPANSLLKVVSSSTSALDVVVCTKSVGIPNQGAPVVKQTAITTATTTTILTGPTTDGYQLFEVESIHIRNKGAANNTVTVTLSWTLDGTTTTSELFEQIMVADADLYYSPAKGWDYQSHSLIGVWNTYTAPANVTNQTADVLGDVTGLTAPILSGVMYEFEATIPYTSGATTTGVRFVTNGPALTSLNGWSVYPITATTKTDNFFAAHGVPAAANADTLATGGLARIGGYIKPSADGTLAIQFASENNAAVVTVLAGASMRVRRVA